MSLTREHAPVRGDGSSMFLIDRAIDGGMRAGLAALAPTLPAGARIEAQGCE